MRFKLLIIISLSTLVLSALIASCSQKSDQSDASAPGEEQLAQYRQRIDVLKQKAQLIKDANDIKRLQRIFGYYFDEGMWDEMANLFSEDATLEYARDGVYQGKARIREYFYALGKGKLGLSEGELNEHFQLMPVITLSEDGITAKGRWRDISLQKGALANTGDQALWGEGPYENEYIKESGVWKIKKMQWFQTVLVPYEGGWAKNADVNKGVYVSKTLSPDAPSTHDYGSWPETFLPPFHFDNPVATYEPTAEGEE